MSIAGSWVNGYGSVMFLEQAQDGSVTGVYISTTGATGAYWVAGYTNAGTIASGMGQAVAISILWRSFLKGTADPSWHYASGMSGQMLPLAPVTNGPMLSLIHDMVATAPDPSVVAHTGAYMDKLAYMPYTGGANNPGTWPPTFTAPSNGDPINGTWNCLEIRPSP